jgi:hypothetical protein
MFDEYRKRNLLSPICAYCRDDGGVLTTKQTLAHIDKVLDMIDPELSKLMQFNRYKRYESRVRYPLPLSYKKDIDLDMRKMQEALEMLEGNDCKTIVGLVSFPYKPNKPYRQDSYKDRIEAYDQTCERQLLLSIMDKLPWHQAVSKYIADIKSNTPKEVVRYAVVKGIDDIDDSRLASVKCMNPAYGEVINAQPLNWPTPLVLVGLTIIYPNFLLGQSCRPHVHGN